MKNLILLALLLSPSVNALTLSDYENLVTRGNSRVESTQDFLSSADLRKAESRILTSIRAFSLLDIENDHKQPQFAAFEGVSKDKRNFQLGLEQDSDLGIKHKLYTKYSYLDQKGASFIPNPKVTDSALVYEFTVPLLKGFFGKIIRNQQELIKVRNEGTLQTQSYESLKVLSNIKSTYWRLKTSREVVKLQQEMIEHSEKFLTWTRKRVRDKLGEVSDLRQAEAILELRKFDLQKEQIELKRAELAFNSLREADLIESIDELEDFPADEVLPVLPTEKEALARPDLLALEAQLAADSLEVEQAYENNKMELNLVGSASSNGLSYEAEPSYSKTFSGKYPNYLIGLRLSVPLDRKSVHDIEKASILKKRGLTAAVRRNRYESVAGLSELRLNYEQLLMQLKVVRKLVLAQKEKLEAERERAQYGRSSTFQLLTFEQDFQQARQDLIRTQGQLWQLTGQAQLYTSQKI